MFYLRQIIFIVMLPAASVSYSQVMLQDYVFDEPEEEPIKEYDHPEPIEGYKALLTFFQSKISNGDTLGRKYKIELYNVRFRVNKLGKIDSAFIGINHTACPIHHEVLKLLKEKQWNPATKEGRPVPYKMELPGVLYFNKNVLKKYDCR